MSEKRPHLNQGTQIAVWAAAAGRCTFCNRLVTENEDLGLIVPIGELAHNVGWGKGSPRGNSALTVAERSSPANLVLLCRNCHKSVDARGVIGYYTIETLQRLKREHEARIRILTEIGADRKALIVRLVGPIRGVSPELTYDTVLTAATNAGFFPYLLPNSYRNAVEIDLREYDEGTRESYMACVAKINDVVARINEGIKRDQIFRLAVFAFARIPLLVHLGAQLDDKVQILIFQRHRVDNQNAWNWPANPPLPPSFAFEKLRTGVDPIRVALMLNISGTIQVSELPQVTQETYTIYSLAPVPPSMSGPSLISSSAALASFEHTVRSFLAHIEKEHGKIPEIALFPAIPISCAVALGRTLMPHVSPALYLFDRNEQNKFFAALEIHR
ncbi:MAG: SAVED domain-containing protein [Ktedonobacteraceae bacterium]